jgi:peroxiredoxin
MKKKLKILIPTIIILLAGFMVFKIHAKLKQKEKITEQIQTLPPMAFTKLNSGELFTDENIEPGKVTLITHFHPDCDFCHAQLKEIAEQLEKFASAQLLLISNAETDSINKMIKEYGLDNKENVTLLYDEDAIFKDVFGEKGVPVSLIYNKKGKLEKLFKGTVKVQEILKYINDEGTDLTD